jgi:hypothetical protein
MKSKRTVDYDIDMDTHQALLDHRKATLNVLLDRIPELTTFSEIGDLLRRSYDWVRVRLIVHPERLVKFGKQYLVPKGVAEDFIRSVFVQ